MSDCPRVLVTAEAFALVVEPEHAPAVVIATGGQGPAGPPGNSTPLPTDPIAYYIIARS